MNVYDIWIVPQAFVCDRVWTLEDIAKLAD